jgi:hypothetical protein
MTSVYTTQDRQYANKRYVEAPSRNHSCHGKSISITYSECVFVALGVQHAKRIRRIIVSPVACPGVQNFSTLSKKSARFSEKRY